MAGARLGSIARATQRQDREARLNMMSASMQGAMAFQKGLGCVHAQPQPGRREPAPAPRHPQRHVPAGRGAFQRAGSVGTDRRLERMAHAMGASATTSRMPFAT
jgi:alcohol dehydrogenase class IV